MRLFSNSSTRTPRRAGLRSLLLGLALQALAGVAAAQDVITLENAADFEGNSGIKFISVPLTYGGAAASTIFNFGRFSIQPLSGPGFNPAVGGAACGPGVDFITVADAFWSTQAGALAGALKFAVQVCGNAVLEGTKHVVVTIRPDSSTGSFCGERCAAIVSILNDDSLPSLVIQNVTVTEPAFVNRTLLLTVKASHPPPLAVTVNFNTRDGTASVATLCKSLKSICSDYAAASGTLTLPAGTTSGTVSVTILPDSQKEPDETFSVVLSNPVNATINSAIGTVTIRDEFLSVGGFSVNQDSDRASVGEVHTVGVDWTVPPHLVWRALDTIDLRIRGAGGDGSFLRWSETANSFSVCRHGYGTGQDDDDGKGKGGGATRFGAICGPAVQPGSFSTLQIGRQAQLDLSRTRAVGSGPAGQSVLLDLALSFLPKTAGHQLTLELAAADDFGNEDRFVPAASVKVDKRR